MVILRHLIVNQRGILLLSINNGAWYGLVKVVDRG